MNITLKNDWIAVLNDPAEIQDKTNLSNLTMIGKGKVALKSSTVTTVNVQDLVLFFRGERTPSLKLNGKSYSVIHVTELIGVLALA